MSESRSVLAVSPSPAETATALTFEERWARWEEKGARHDARVARNMRVVLMLLITFGVIWFSVLLR
ncbi:MAG TPA: hypothetical protein VH701_18835 [Vicinamibacterales bacterium]